MTYACLKLAFFNYCYSAPLWPIVVRLVSVIFALSVYHIAKCRENTTLYIGFRGRRKFLINFQFSLAHKKASFNIRTKAEYFGLGIGPKFTSKKFRGNSAKIPGLDRF